MSALTIDDQLAGRLGETAGPIELRTHDGRRVGTFTPAPPEPKISPEEMQRLLSDPNTTWHTAADVEAKMKGWRCSQ